MLIFFVLLARKEDIFMTEILKTVGIDDFTTLMSVLILFVSVCAFFTALIVEGLKSISAIDKLPTKLVVYIVAVILTTPIFVAMMAFLKQPIEWFMIFGSFLASFVVANVSMNGWDDITELKDRLFKK
jgi:hypothetical protein